jgi:hypothetical protein
LQGEGQEFESPRLHHHLAACAVTTIEHLGVHPETPTAHHTGAIVPRDEPLIRVLPHGQATDQRIAGRRIDLGRSDRWRVPRERAAP